MVKASETGVPEFDAYAPAYDELLNDPLRNRFARDPLHFHRRKWQLIQSLLQRAGTAPKALRWLDVGCGQGELLSLAGSAFASAAGCDPSPGMLAPQAAYETRVQPSLTELPFATASIDFVTAVCVYHHVHGAARKLLTDEVKRVLTPGGTLLVTDLVEHDQAEVTGNLAHRWPGFSDDAVNRMFTASEVEWRDPVTIPGPLPIRIWPAIRTMADVTRELAL